jgi:hypothetical protein
MLASDVERITKQPTGGSVQLLPSFDPYVMGHASRDHIVEAANLSKVSRTAGWISPVVLVDGRVAGTWSHIAQKGTLQVTVEPFRPIAARTKVEVRRRAESLAETLGLARTEVRIP